jgi:hypothetical protein
MNPGGWIMIIATWSLITLLCGFCFWKVFAKKNLD